MQNEEVLVIEVEVCIDCQRHVWFTSHREEKYLSMFEQLSSSIKSVYPDAIILRNFIPSYFKKIENNYVREDMYYDTNKDQIIVKPKIGAFEVRIGDNLLFSKIQTGRWPYIPDVIAKIGECIGVGPPSYSLGYGELSTNLQASKVTIQSSVAQISLSQRRYRSVNQFRRTKKESIDLSKTSLQSIRTTPIQGRLTREKRNDRMNQSMEIISRNSDLNMSTLYFKEKFNDPRNSIRKKIDFFKKTDEDILRLNKRTNMMKNQICNTGLNVYKTPYQLNSLENPLRRSPIKVLNFRPDSAKIQTSKSEATSTQYSPNVFGWRQPTPPKYQRPQTNPGRNFNNPPQIQLHHIHNVPHSLSENISNTSSFQNNYNVNQLQAYHNFHDNQTSDQIQENMIPVNNFEDKQDKFDNKSRLVEDHQPQNNECYPTMNEILQNELPKQIQKQIGNK